MGRRGFRESEHFRQFCTVRLRVPQGNGTFDFWLRFGPGTGS
jgi:hypothetical protein